jgi:hypothetical protein
MPSVRSKSNRGVARIGFSLIVASTNPAETYFRFLYAHVDLKVVPTEPV